MQPSKVCMCVKKVSLMPFDDSINIIKELCLADRGWFRRTPRQPAPSICCNGSVTGATCPVCLIVPLMLDPTLKFCRNVPDQKEKCVL